MKVSRLHSVNTFVNLCERAKKNEHHSESETEDCQPEGRKNAYQGGTPSDRSPASDYDLGSLAPFKPLHCFEQARFLKLPVITRHILPEMAPD